MSKKDDKSELQKLADKILVKRKPASDKVDSKKAHAFAEDYKDFITKYKTEREIVAAIVERAKKAGFSDIRSASKVTKGGKYYRVDNNKNVALITFNGLDAVHAIGSHCDSPCLHLKPYPLLEMGKLAVFKTHYYGGVKKYQYLNIPLALHGVAHTQDGKKVEIVIGEDPKDPIFTIPDLLPHLAREQLDGEARKLVKGEQLNAVVGIEQVEDEAVSEKAKLAVAKFLHDKYGLVEADLVSAELMFVPAGPARDAGFDSGMVVGYGQDDSSSVYASLLAHLDAKEGAPTQITLFYDKEEIGSYGKTGAQNMFFNSLIEELIELSGSDLRQLQVWSNMKFISADVTAAIDPNFSDVHDSTNANHLGYGVAVEKYGGGGGKYSTNDADAEYMHAITTLFDKKKVPWQTGELGRIDLGGGGTIAMYFSKYGADVVDIGVPVLGMHAPYEVLSKDDLYAAYLCYKVFLENTL